MMSYEDIKKYAVAARSVGKAKETKIKSERVYYQKYDLTRDLLKNVPYYQQFCYMWTFFVSGVIISIASIILSLLGIKAINSQLNYFLIIEFICYILILRFGVASASFSQSNRKFTFIFMLLIGIISYLVLLKWNLGPYNISIILQMYLNANKYVINFIISFLNSVIACALCTPMLQEFHGYLKITHPPAEFLNFQFCREIFSKMVKWPRRLIRFVFRITPFIPIICYIPRMYWQNDLIFDSVFVLIEMIIAVIKFSNIFDQIQVLILTPISSLTAFDEKRTDKTGKYAIACLNRVSLLPGFWATAMCVHPMIVFLLGTMYFSHFFIEGSLSICTNQISIYLIVLSDFILSFYHVVGIFISGE